MTISPVPYPIYLADGLVRYITGLSPGIVPVTTLTVEASVGATTLQVANTATAAAFIPDTVISFMDETGEKKVVVDHVDLTTSDPTITLKFDGRPAPGLLYDHPIGTVVATNIFRTYLGERVNDSLDNGYPLLAIWIQNNAKMWRANLEWQNQAIASVLYRLSGKQPDGPKLHPQIWLEETLDRAEIETQALVSGLQQNSTIKVAGVSYAFLITQFITARRDSLADAANPVFEFLVDIHAQGTFENVR